MKKTQVYYFAKGHLGQHEDWWYLIENDDGSYQIEHEWDHVSTGSSHKSEGSQTFSLEEGLKRVPHNAVEKINEILGIFG
ncbi:hypothetical protein GOC53_00840 [Sinorhizobium medicae]|nr:hypothetical protein [Sinorhizobium medicae]